MLDGKEAVEIHAARVHVLSDSILRPSMFSDCELNSEAKSRHAKVWDVKNCASHEEHKSKAHEVLRNETSKGCVQDVSALQLA